MVRVYSKPGCQKCRVTKMTLDKKHVPYEDIDVTEDHDARDYLVSMGFSEMPVVFAGDRQWSGFSSIELARL